MSTDYQYGFSSDLDQEIFPVGLNQSTIERISATKNEPNWLLQYRLKAFQFWQKSRQPNWAKLNIKPIDYQAISYFASVKQSEATLTLSELKKNWLLELAS